MDEFPLVLFTSPSLLEVCLKVGMKEGDPNYMTPEERGQLAMNMCRVMVEGGGVGLSGPQVARNLRVIVYQDTRNQLHAYYNPTVTLLGDYKQDLEGCLSFPGKTKRVRRAGKILVEAFLPDGEPVKFKAEGLVARVIQHEVDHLDGKLVFSKEEIAAMAAESELSRVLYSECFRNEQHLGLQCQGGGG